MRRFLRTALVSAVAALAACSSDLDVTNVNNADIDRALAKPSDVENLLSGGFNQVVSNTTGGAIDNPNTAYQVMSFENYSGLANFGMGPRAGLPRTPIVNGLGNPSNTTVLGTFNGLSRQARATTIALERLAAPGFTLGSAAADLRARSYGRFVLGLSLGYLALSYDSAAVVVPGADAVPALVGYDSVMKAALKQLDDALADATNPTANGTGGFPLPASWLNLTTGSVSADLFAQIIRTYRARFRAQVARTAAQRAAANWTQILSDAQNGIRSDVSISMNATTGWTQAWVVQHYAGPNWHIMTPQIIGMADSVGAQYATWLNQPLLNRTPFLIRTVDKRFPSGDSRDAQNVASNGGAIGSAPLPGVYFRNRRSADDGAANDGTWGFSFYDFVRFQSFQNAARIGPYPHLVMAEVWALIAEGAIRTGNFALAATNIDQTRVSRGGLPSVAGITNLTDPVPGGNACVPRIPVATGSTFTTRCGNILEAMKWEKRMETAYINYGAWFLDMRGWGDLAEGTPIELPVPWQERQVRVQPPNNIGGVGLPGGAPRGTYGLP